MKKYSDKLLRDYIEGNDIIDYDIDALEEDYTFMRDVINYTNDKKMYNLCSDNVKTNYDFVKFLVYKFQENKNFICNVADYYLDNTDDRFSRIELSLIMGKLTKKNKEYYLKYKIMADAIYFCERTEIECTKTTVDDPELLDALGMGFWVVMDNYLKSDIVMQYYAQKYINDIFVENDIVLEKMLHEKFKNFEDLEKIGVNNFLLNFIKLYDSYLASYLQENLYLLDDLRKEITKIKLNWDNFNYQNEQRRYNLIIESVYRYMSRHEFECSFCSSEVLYHIAKEFKITDKIRKFDYICDEDYDDLMNSVLINEQHMDILDYKHYFNIKKLILTILKQKVVEDIEEQYEEKTQETFGERILNIDFKNKKVIKE